MNASRSSRLNLYIGVALLVFLGVLLTPLWLKRQVGSASPVNKDPGSSPQTSQQAHALRFSANQRERLRRLQALRREHIERQSILNAEAKALSPAYFEQKQELIEREAMMAPIREAQRLNPTGKVQVLMKPLNPTSGAPVLIWNHDDPELDGLE